MDVASTFTSWLQYGALGVLTIAIIVCGFVLYKILYKISCGVLDVYKKHSEWEIQSRGTLEEALTRLTESIEKIAVATERSTAAVYMLADIVGRIPDVSEDDVNRVKEISHPAGKTKIMRRKPEIEPE